MQDWAKRKLIHIEVTNEVIHCANQTIYGKFWSWDDPQCYPKLRQRASTFIFNYYSNLLL